MPTIRPYQKDVTQAGFTLLELSIVIGVSTLLLLMVMGMFTIYNKQVSIEKSKRSVANAQAAVARFYELEGRYPCPARANLMPGDTDFGKEDCTITTTAGMRTGVSGILVGTFPVYADGTDGRIDLTGLIEKNEIINTSLKDGYNNYLNYAVTQSLTRKFDPASPTTTFDPFRGAIKVRDEFGRDTGGTKQDAHYFIYSGGYRGNGVKNATSGMTLACDNSFTLEHENCDGDGEFVAGIKSDNEKSPGTAFDNYVAFSSTVPMGLWTKMPVQNASGGIDKAEDSISTVTRGNVGVGMMNTATGAMAAPRAKLEIGRYDSADAAVAAKSTLKADKATIAQQICDADNPSSTCFTPESLIEMKCPPRQYIKGTHIVANKLEPICQEINFSPSATCQNITLPDGTTTNGIIRGIRSDGTVECASANESIKLETMWVLIPGDDNSNTLAMNLACPSGWTPTWITDDTGGSGRNLNEEKKNGKHLELCMRTTDPLVIFQSQWVYNTAYTYGTDSSPACPAGYVDSTLRDDYFPSKSNNNKHSTSEEEDPFRNNMRWCAGITGKGYKIAFLWVSGSKKSPPQCPPETIWIIDSRNGHRNFNSEADSGVREKLCARLVAP